jgi:hypothetical protein
MPKLSPQQQVWLNVYNWIQENPTTLIDLLKEPYQETDQDAQQLEKILVPFINKTHDITFRTLLDQAASCLRPEIMKWLLQLGADPNHQSKRPGAPRNTAAHFVLTTEGNLEEKLACIKVLMRHGINPHLANTEGQTAWSIAMSYPKPNVGSFKRIMHFQTVAYGNDIFFLKLNKHVALSLEFVARYLDARNRDTLRLVNKSLATAIPPSALQLHWQEIAPRNPIAELRQNRQKHHSWQEALESAAPRKATDSLQKQ